MSAFCCPRSHLRWSPSSRFGGILCCNWPCMLSTQYSTNFEYVPRIVKDTSFPSQSNQEQNFIVEVDLSSTIPPFSILLGMSFIPVIPCVILGQNDFHAVAWHFYTEPDQNTLNETSYLLHCRIREKNRFSERILASYGNITSAYLEIFQDVNPENELTIWKERLVIRATTCEQLVSESIPLNEENLDITILTTPWFTRSDEIHVILEDIQETVMKMIPQS
jgi:hypothetical protein